MADFKKIAKLSELKEGKIKGVQVNGESVALYNLGGEIFATSNVCTHAECSLAENGVIGEDGEIVECMCHGSHFNIKTGEVTSPPAFEPLKTYQVKVEGDDVLVEV